MTNINKFEVKTADGSFVRRPANYNDSRVLAATVAEKHTVPTDSQTNGKAQSVLFSANCDFWILPITTAQENIAVNGTFAADISWTKGAGWTIAAGVATATGAISTALTQTAVASSTTALLVAGQAYSVTYTVTVFTAGTVTVSLGGTAGTARSSAATFTETIVAGATQVIAFTGAGFTGSIDNVTITPIAVAPAADITTGVSPELNPNAWLLGGDVSSFSMVSTAGGIVGMSFYM